MPFLIVERNTEEGFSQSPHSIPFSEFVRKVYVSESVGPNSRGRSLGRRKDRVKEYMCERGATRRRGFEQARRECLDREIVGPNSRGRPLGR